MQTKKKSKNQKTSVKSQRDKKQGRTEHSTIEQGTADFLSTDQIDFSPLNYRKYFRKEDLESFAQELKLHGIISPLTVRKLDSGSYELVAGERRLRAARIAKLTTVPVIIKQLTDEQVTEIQLAENLQRENPHPIDEAKAIQLMQQTGKTIDEIAARLGKSKQFVYVRLKLLNLIDHFQDMFFADVITIQEATEIATISQEGQCDFFEQHCKGWEKQKHFKLSNLQYYLRQYKYDLRNAPFNTKDKKLVPEVGACSTCSFNSATLKSLFPEYAKQAICTNPTCYQTKCVASLKIRLVLSVAEHEPTALLFNGEPSPVMKELLVQVDQAASLPLYDGNEVTILKAPEMPDKSDYTFEYSDDEPEFEEENYNEAMVEYKTELEEYQLKLESNAYQKALLERNGEFISVLFSPEPPPRYTDHCTSKGLTMKAVQEAIKAGTATPALLQEAIAGMLQREERAKQIDRDKVQVTVHTQLEERIRNVEFNDKLTDTDLAAARLLIYQSLDYTSRGIVHKALFEESEEHEADSNDAFYQKLVSLTNQQYSYLIRMAIACKSDAKYPRTETGFVLYKVAEAAGINVVAIENAQQEKAVTRSERLKERIKELEKKVATE